MRCTPLFPRGAGPQKPWAIGIRKFWPKTIQGWMTVRRSVFTPPPPREWNAYSKILGSTRSDVPWMRSWNTIGNTPPSSPCWSPQPPRRKRGKHCALTQEIIPKGSCLPYIVYNCISPRELTLHASLPIRPRTNCVYSHSLDVVWAGRSTQSVTWSAFALKFLCLCLSLDIHEFSMLLDLSHDKQQ